MCDLENVTVLNTRDCILKFREFLDAELKAQA